MLHMKGGSRGAAGAYRTYVNWVCFLPYYGSLDFTLLFPPTKPSSVMFSIFTDHAVLLNIADLISTLLGRYHSVWVRPLLTIVPSRLRFPSRCMLIASCTFEKLSISKLEKELVKLEEEKKAVQAVQKLKHKQIALLLQSLADIEANVDEVKSARVHGLVKCIYPVKRAFHHGLVNDRLRWKILLGCEDSGIATQQDRRHLWHRQLGHSLENGILPIRKRGSCLGL